MPQPPEYVRIFNFTDFSIVSPADQQPGVQLDAEFNAIKQTADQVRTNLGKIQSDDGTLANGVVRSANLSSEIIVGFDPPAQWEPDKDYLSTSAVFHGGKLYKANVAHTSELPFDESKWDVIADFAGLTTEAGHWANYPVDQLVPEGDGIDDYSALHHNTKAQEAKVSAAADAISADSDATAASNSAAASATSESNASASESAAATYASNAADSAADANDSAVSAENSAQIATAAEEGSLATTTQPGVARLATQVIAEDGEDNTRIMTPKRVVDYVNSVRTAPQGIAPLNTLAKVPPNFLTKQIEWLDRPYSTTSGNFLGATWHTETVSGDGLINAYPDAQFCQAVMVNFSITDAGGQDPELVFFARAPDAGSPPSFEGITQSTRKYEVGLHPTTASGTSLAGNFWVRTAAGPTYREFWWAVGWNNDQLMNVVLSVTAFARY